MTGKFIYPQINQYGITMTVRTKNAGKKGREFGEPDALNSFNEISWMSAHRSELAKHSGKWVALKPSDGIIASNNRLTEVMKEWRKRYPGETPFVFMVPRESEGAFVP